MKISYRWVKEYVVTHLSAQAVADSLVNAGVRGIVNFAPIVLRLPAHVSLVAVDLTVQLEQLAFQVQHSDVK